MPESCRSDPDASPAVGCLLRTQRGRDTASFDALLKAMLAEGAEEDLRRPSPLSGSCRWVPAVSQLQARPFSGRREAAQHLPHLEFGVVTQPTFVRKGRVS